MNVDVEKLSNVEIKVNVEIPAEEVDRELDKQYRELAKSITLRGFRKGKAPRGMLEKRFGKEVAADTARVLMTERLEEALKKVEDNALGEPVIENDPVERGQAFRFSLRLETRPEFEPQGYKELTLPPVDDSVSDEEIDARLQTLREGQASLVPVDEGEKADTGHLVVADFQGTQHGEPFPGGTAEDVSIELGSGRMIPGFEDEVMGAVEGETREFDITFPEDYPAEHLAGKPAHFTVTVKEIKRKELPDLDDEFAVDQGADDLAALKSRIRDDIAREKRSQAEEERKKALVDQLIEKNPLDVPPRLLEAQAHQRMHDLAHRLEHAGHDHDRAHQIVESQADAFTKAAERELHEHFILRRIAEAENITVTDEDVEAWLEELAEATKMPIQKLRARLHDPEAKAGLESELRERKVRDAVIEWSESGEAAPGEDTPEEAAADEPAEAEAAAEEPEVEDAPAEEAAAEESASEAEDSEKS